MTRLSAEFKFVSEGHTNSSQFTKALHFFPKRFNAKLGDAMGNDLEALVALVGLKLWGPSGLPSRRPPSGLKRFAPALQCTEKLTSPSQLPNGIEAKSPWCSNCTTQEVVKARQCLSFGLRAFVLNLSAEKAERQCVRFCQIIHPGQMERKSWHNRDCFSWSCFYTLALCSHAESLSVFRNKPDLQVQSYPSDVTCGL